MRKLNLSIQFSLKVLQEWEFAHNVTVFDFFSTSCAFAHFSRLCGILDLDLCIVRLGNFAGQRLFHNEPIQRLKSKCALQRPVSAPSNRRLLSRS